MPAVEVYLYESMLIVDKEIKKEKLQSKARKKDRGIITKKEHDFLVGTITFDSDKQKCFYCFEIPYRLREAGFTEIKIGKVLYSWEEFSKAGKAYFSNADLPWDWYVSCTKK